MSTTDLSLSDQVLDALHNNPHLTGRTFRFEADQGRVTLRGEVRSYYQKQMAQEALRRINGIDEIQNDLEVSLR